MHLSKLEQAFSLSVNSDFSQSLAPPLVLVLVLHVSDFVKALSPFWTMEEAGTSIPIFLSLYPVLYDSYLLTQQKASKDQL